MLRAIIVDDEAMICELIKRLVDWEYHGVEVVGTAHSGNRALALVEQERPDIVITDIRMPNFDGLELIRRTQAILHQVKFIVISGYREFDYAHSALHYGVKDYLLKPVNADELNHALSRITADILQEQKARRSQEQVEEISAKLNVSNAQLRHSFVLRLAERRLEKSELSLETVNTKYGFSFQDRPFGVFIVKASCHDLSKSDLVPLSLSRAIATVQSALRTHSLSPPELAILGTRLYVVFQPTEHTDLRQLYRELAEELDAAVSPLESFALSLCPAPCTVDIAHLLDAAESAENTIPFRFLTPPGKPVELNLAEHTAPVDIDRIFPPAQHTYFLQILQSRDRRRVENSLRQLFAPLLHTSGTPCDSNAVFKLCSQVLHIARSLPEAESIPLCFTNVEKAMDLSASSVGLISNFRSAFLQEMEPYFSQVETKAGAPVQRAVQFINEHYAEPLTLDTVASQTGLSSAYLCTLFKKEVGSSFSEYLTMRRMGVAKELLRKTQKSVAEIAEETGYMDAKYFTKVFTKSFGIAPQKYRKL